MKFCLRHPYEPISELGSCARCLREILHNITEVKPRPFSETYEAWKPVNTNQTGPLMFVAPTTEQDAKRLSQPVGFPIHITTALPKGTIALITNSSDIKPTPHYSGTHYLLIRSEPFAVVTGDDLKLLNVLAQLLYLNREEDHWRHMRDVQRVTAEEANNKMHTAIEKVHELGEKRLTIMKQLYDTRSKSQATD